MAHQLFSFGWGSLAEDLIYNSFVQEEFILTISSENEKKEKGSLASFLILRCSLLTLVFSFWRLRAELWISNSAGHHGVIDGLWQGPTQSNQPYAPSKKRAKLKRIHKWLEEKHSKFLCNNSGSSHMRLKNWISKSWNIKRPRSWILLLNKGVLWDWRQSI